MADQVQYYVTCLFGAITAVSVFKVFKSQVEISSNKTTLDNFLKAPIKSPDDLRPNGQKVVVKGVVARNDSDSRNDLITQKTEKKQIQQYVVYLRNRETIYSNDNFSNKQQYFLNAKDLIGRADISINPSFILKGSKKQVRVENWDSINYLPALEITRWDNRRRRLNFTQKLEALMLSYFRAIGTLVVADKGRPTYLKGIDVGTRQVEAGLKVGATVMAFGTVGISSEGGLFLEPSLFFKDRLSFISDLQQKIKENEGARNLWAILLAIGVVYLGRRVYKYNKKHNILDLLKNKLKSH